ncbi:lanthionine synthetase C family protein [Nocardiopsis sp. RSe5-2]|uniref:Lanthionine synthetase C family protein n=1 Tax=Nocardiopsis endophytica TaxID=3018445 RepID=A0ABT4U2G2_9ACTN|nr:lanthionine synthetase C family protein [Nocardiopsis endophytica]MDA2810876.1 lanthionine synthetase C family protein [Nocardiopsis endophytica]
MNTTALIDSELRARADAFIERWARRPVEGFDQDSAHSLAAGQAGDALAHAELAARGRTDPGLALRALTRAAQGDISASPSAGLYWGAPAVAFALHSAGPHRAHAKALATLHTHIARTADQRAQQMTERINRQEPARFGEYDVFFGLTGIGAYLLRTAPDSPELARVLTALSALVRPLPLGRARVPGWWVANDPHNSPTAPEGGHANLGAAHGITGPLMLLSQASRAGTTAPGQMSAIEHLAAFLLDWSRPGPTGRWWPEHLTLTEYTARTPAQQGPARPSWCYGTPGIARAGQLAALALGERHLRSVFESALADCLSDPHQLATLSDARLCHGWAGLFQTAWRAAADAADPRLAGLLPALAQRFTAAIPVAPSREAGLLDGDAGVVLALLTATEATVETGWDACLLIN